MLSKRELMSQLSKRLDWIIYSGVHSITLPREELEAIITHLNDPQPVAKEEAVYDGQQWCEFNYGAD